jgi:hypothetical protein
MRREFDIGGAGVRVESFPAGKRRAHAPQVAARAPALSRSRQLTVYSISLGVWLSGAVWLLAHYFMEREGTFGPSPHPLEFWSIAAHGAFALATLWMLGLLWAIHIPAGWRSLRRRWTGSLMFGVAAVLILTGYLLYYLGDADARPALAVLHWVVGLACPALFLMHRFARDRAL